MDATTSLYSGRYGVTQFPLFKTEDPWEPAKVDICKRLSKTGNQLCLMKCHGLGLPTRIAEQVVQTLVVSTALFNTEIWQNGATVAPIQQEMDKIYRKLIDVPLGTSNVAIHYECGLIDQCFRANAAALKFRNHVIGLPENRMVKQMYMALLTEIYDNAQSADFIVNNVTTFLEPLSILHNWKKPVGASAATTKAHTRFGALYKTKKWSIN